jgi:hypothetical protein
VFPSLINEKKMVTTKNGVAEENVSHERQLYAALFPGPREVNKTQAAVLVSFEELQRTFPERVLPARIDEIFRAWMEEEVRLPPKDRVRFNASLLNQLKRTHLPYKFDHYEYMSSMFYFQFQHSHRLPQYNIKLANDGFIYPSSSTLETNSSYNDVRPYHGSTGWSQLSDQTLQNHFKSLVAFAKIFLETDKVGGQVLYDETEERIDFRFKVQDGVVDKVRLVITFEPGHPLHWHDDDHWGSF